MGKEKPATKVCKHRKGLSAVPEETGRCAEMGDNRYCGNWHYRSGGRRR